MMIFLWELANPDWQAVYRFCVDCSQTVLSTIQQLFTIPMVRYLSVGCLFASVISMIFVIGLAWYIVKMLTCPKKYDQFLPLSPYALGLPAEVVTFPCRGEAHQVRGLYIPASDATSTILICPGYRRALSDVLVTCKHVWDAGHNVLAFEFYGHGLPVGNMVTLGYREIDDFLGAVSYAALRAPTARLGAIGYSMGAATAIMAVARTKKVEALVADSGFATQWSAVAMAVKRTLRIPLPAWSMRVLYLVTDFLLWLRAGYHFSQVEPIRQIGQIAPRPLLLIHGLQDTVVDPRDATRLYEAASDPKELWMIPECEHIRGYFSDPSTYTAKVIAFLEQLKMQPSLEMHPPRFFWQSTPSLTSTLSHSHEHSPQRRVTKRHIEESNSLRSQRAYGHDQQFSPVMQEEHHLIRHTEPLLRNSSQLSPLREKRNALRKRRLMRSFHLRYAHLKTTTTHRLHRLGIVYGHFTYRWRWLILALWIVALIGSVPFASSLSNVLHNSGYVINGSESNRVDTVLSEKLHHPVSQLLVLFQSDAMLVSAPRYQQEVHAFLSHVRTLHSVTSVTQGGVGRNDRTTYVTIGFSTDQDVVVQQLPTLRALLPRSADNPARATVTGDAAISNEIQMDTQTDTEQAERIALPLTFLVLLLAFGSVTAGLMPLALAAVTVPTTLAIIYSVAIHVETNIFVLNVASIIGLGLSIDYSLFIIRRFREELAREQQSHNAIGLTVATAGESVICSGLTVMVGFSGLFFVGIPIMSSFALGGITVAAVAVVAALTLLPALLSIMGPRINALCIPLSRVFHFCKTSAQAQKRRKQRGFWYSWARIVMRRPVMMIVLVIATLVSLGWPALSLNPGLPGVAALPRHSEARQSLDVLKNQFPDVNVDPILVVAQTPDGSNMLTEQNLNKLQALSQRLVSLPHVVGVTDLLSLPAASRSMVFAPQQLRALYSSGKYQRVPSLAQLVTGSTRGDITLITIRSDVDSNSQALINNVRDVNQHANLGLNVLVGGSQAITLDFDHVLYGNFLRVFLFILLATYVLLLIMFRSIILPLKAIVMNVLSISVAYGALVFGFQQGHFQEILNFTSDGSIDRFIPVLLFCVIFGLSMDYEVFLLSRIQEEWRNTGDNSAAVAYGLEHTGGIITNAALLFMIVSASFMTTSLIVTKELGLGITVAVLVDASIIRSVLVPATMQVMGRWNWWFPGMRKGPQRVVVQGLPVYCKRLGGKVRVTRMDELNADVAIPERAMIRTGGRREQIRDEQHLLKREQPAARSTLKDVLWPIMSDTPFFYTSYQDRLHSQPLFQEDVLDSSKTWQGVALENEEGIW